MKPDQNYISRLEVGDTFQNTRGETCRVNKIQRNGTIEAGTVGYPGYLRIYDRDGSGSPASESIKTP